MRSPPTDDELMLQIKAGDSRAFHTLFERHSSAVFGYCICTLGGNQALAEDILQEVWLKVAKQATNYDPRGHFKAWLMTVTRNETISHIRKQLILEDEPGQIEQEEAGEDASAERQLLLQTDARLAQNAIASLPETQRVALMLSVVDELSLEEIAGKMEVTVSAAKSLVFRARQELRRKLRKS